MPQNPGTAVPEIVEATRRQWRLVALLLLAIVAGAYYYASSLPARYTAKSVVSLTPRPQSGATATDVTQLGQRYVAFVTSPTTLRRVASEVGLSTTALDRGVSAEMATASVNLTISVKLAHPGPAADAANRLADEAVSLSDSDKLLTGDTVVQAVVPTSPSGPRRRLIEAAGLLVALIVAIVAALLVERGRPRVRGASDVTAVAAHPVIGRVPKSRAVRGGMDAALADPLVGGAIRSLRTVLEHEARSAPVHTLAVTSSIAEEGKSTVAAALATAIARLDARVLLLDADLRHPTVHAGFGVPQSPGLADVVSGSVEFPAAVTGVKHTPGLYVMPTSKAPDGGDVLATRLRSVLDDATGGFDVVIVDSPPLLAGDDAGTIATQCDAVLLVVAAGLETRRLAEATQILDTLGVRVLGALLNRGPVATFSEAYRYGERGRRSRS